MKRVLLLFGIILFTVLKSQAQYWIFDDLSEPKSDIGIAAQGDNVFFAGGLTYGGPVSEVEVYNISNEEWDTVIQLSVDRAFLSGVSSGTQVLFAGGFDETNGGCFSEVDIWDAVNKSWSYDNLSAPRFFISGVSKGNKVLFAGGMNTVDVVTYDIVDIYDTEIMDWIPPATLSEPRAAMASAVLGDLAFFAGGFDLLTSEVSNVVDIYRFSTNSWTSTTLSKARAFAAAVAIGSKVLIAGGVYDVNVQSDIVDVYDTVTGIWTTDTLSFPRSFLPWNAATINSGTPYPQAYFTGGGNMDLSLGGWTTESDVIDIYDGALDQWTVDNLAEPLINHATIGIEDHLLVAGGVSGSPAAYVSTVEILVVPVGIKSQERSQPLCDIYPNPSNGYFNLDMPEQPNTRQAEIAIFNFQGQMVYQQTLPAGDQSINVQLPDGVYVMQIRMGDVVQKGLLTIIK